MLADILFHLNISWLLFGAITALFLYWFWTKPGRPYLKYNIPPFPVSPLPIVGHFLSLGFNFREVMNQWRTKAGDIFSLEIGGQLHIIVSGHDNIKEVLVKHADHIPNTEHLFYEDVLNEHNKGIFAGRDGNWKEQRTVSLAILRDFGMGKNVLAEKIQEEVSVFIERLAGFNGKPENIRILTNESVSNVICSIIVGKRFDYDDPYFVRFMGLNNNVMKYFNNIVMLTAFPFLYYLPGDFFKAKKWIKSVVELNEMFAKKYIRKFMKTFNEDEEPSNFINEYLRDMFMKKDHGRPVQLDEENLVAIIRLLFIAGSETTSTTIMWCLLYMLYNPEMQEKVYREIEEQVGTERIPLISDRSKLTYLNAVVMETQRMASVVPIGLRREVSEPFEMGGYTFPKDSIVWPNLDSVMFDKQIWGDPEKFRPERFLDSKGALLHREELIPFSVGRRTCLGQNLATMELFLFLANMFQRFRFEPADDTGRLPSTEPIIGATCMPQAFEVRFIERNA